MTEGNLTHRDLARLLGVSETTVKSYRRKFPDCIPVASQGKPIRFTAEAAAVSLRIRDLFEMGMSVEEVRARLAAEFAWITPEAPASDDRDDAEPAEPAAPAAPAQPARVELPQDFTLAVSNLAKSMVGLTQQQNAILKRVQHIETLITALAPVSGDGSVPGATGETGETGTPGATGLQGRPAWLDEAQALAARFEALLGAVAGPEGADAGHPASVAASRAPSSAPAMPENPAPATPGGEAADAEADAALASSAPSALSGGRVVPFPGGMAVPASDVPNGPTPLDAAFPAPQDPPRHLLALPLVVQSPQGEFLGVAGRARGRFCINDLKAMLAFAFQPPDNYVLRSEPAEDGGWWLTLEQPQAETPYDVVLLVDESVTPRGNQVAVVRRYVANGVESHPTEIYGFLRAVQG